MYYTPERAKKMLFSALPMLSLYTTLNVRADDGRYSYEDFPSFRGMKVGIIANSKDGEKIPPVLPGQRPGPDHCSLCGNRRPA